MQRLIAGRSFTVQPEAGKCVNYQEVLRQPPRKEFDFILELPATVFEGVVAGLVDPVQGQASI